MSKLALITGASGGIGLELALELAQNKYDLILVARSENKLEELAARVRNAYGVKAQVIALDLGAATAARELHNQCRARQLAPDILVNNAGFGFSGDFVTSPVEEQSSMIDLNITTLTLLCRYFGADFAARGSGQIMNVASTAAYQPGPYLAVYYATKAYVLSFSEALREELAPRGVQVSTLCPGPTPTGFQDRAALGNADLFKVPWLLSAKEVAHQAYRRLECGRGGTIITGFINAFMAFMVRFLPRRLVAKVTGRLNRAA